MATYDPIKIIRQDMDKRFKDTIFIAQISNINKSYYTADISMYGDTIPGASFLDDVNVEDMENDDVVICVKVLGKIFILGGISPTTNARSTHSLFGHLEIGGQLDLITLPNNLTSYYQSTYEGSYIETAFGAIAEDEYAGEIRRYDKNLYLYSSSYSFSPSTATSYDFGWKFVKSDDARYLQGHPVIDQAPTVGQALVYDTAGGWKPSTITVPANIYPTRATMWHQEALVTVGNAIAQYIISAMPYCAYWRQNAAANGDTFTHSCMLAAGTYSFYVEGHTWLDMGKIDWYVDNVKVVSLQDWYGSEVYGVVKSAASITVSGSGRHVIKGVVNGKHASSGGYQIPLVKYWFTQSVDVVSVE
jgi:hypothetical protein